MQRERILLVELPLAEYAQAHSTNRVRSLGAVIIIVLVIAAVGPGLNTKYKTYKDKDKDKGQQGQTNTSSVYQQYVCTVHPSKQNQTILLNSIGTLFMHLHTRCTLGE